MIFDARKTNSSSNAKESDIMKIKVKTATTSITVETERQAKGLCKLLPEVTDYFRDPNTGKYIVLYFFEES